MNMHSEIISPQMNPKSKISHLMYILGKNSTGNLPSQRCGVSMSTRFCPLDPLPAPVPLTACCLSLNPVSHRTVTATKLLVLFYSPTESLRPGTSSSAWNQDQQHEDDFLFPGLPGSFSLHTHTLSFPSHFSWSLVMCCLVWHLISEGLHKLS